MSKRLHDTDIWKKKWFRQLSPAEKCLWFWIKDQCDCAGIWDCDEESAQFHIGCSNIDLTVFNKHLQKISSNKYYLTDFIEFQYGLPLNEKSPVHKKVIIILGKYKIFPNTLCNTLLNRVSNRGKEEEEDKDKEKDKNKRGIVKGEKILDHVTMTKEEKVKLVDEHGEDNFMVICDILNSYKGSTGKKYKSDYLAIKNWVIDRAKKEGKYRKEIDYDAETAF